MTGGSGANQTAFGHRAVNLAHALIQIARRLPDSEALIYGDTRWTWRDFDTRVSALAAELIRRGVRAGDCVLLDAPNHPEFVQAMYATWRVGAVLAPVNSRLHDNEIAAIATVCRPVMMLAHASTKSHVDAVSSALRRPVMTLWLDAEGTDGVTSLPTSPIPVPDANVWGDDAAWYFFTSGTSGTPKAAVLSHRQLGYVVTNHLADLMPTTIDTDRSLVVAPLSHGAGVHLLPQVARGAASVIPTSTSLDPSEVWRLVEREHVANMFTVPTILKRLVEHPAVAEHDHSSLRYVIYAGAPIARRDQERAHATLGEVLVQYYGLAEVTGNITVLPPRHHGRIAPPGIELGTCGWPRTGMQVIVQNDDGVEAAPLQTGEICVAGPAVCNGYFDNDVATATAFRDGWFHTGDVGMVDENGLLYITGRLSDMYISGGSNIHPRDIEEKLLGHPALDEAVVLGMPDATWGEVGVAVCVVRANVSEHDLRAWLGERISRYKVPRHFVFWASLPRSGYGKVARREVRKLLLERGWKPEPAVSTAGVQQ